MFGLGFLNSIFLSALVLGAVPVIIHLLNRTRIRRIKFSSLEFLDELSKRRMRKINLRRILILILRTLAVLLIVMAFARPTMQTALMLPGGAPKNVVICIDASYSMGVEQELGTAFTSAREIARQIVDESGKDDVINVVAFSERADAQLEQGTRNKNLARGTIESAPLTAEGTSLRRAVDTALELIAASEVEGGEVHVISDFRHSLDSTVVDPDALPDNVRVFLLPVSQEPVDNVSIDKVMVPRKLLRPGEVIRVSVAVTNHSAERPANFPMELAVEGSRKAEKLINLAPSASATVTFPISFTDWGVYHCTVSKNRDRLPVDDERFFLLEVSRSVPVTLVRGLRQLGEGESAQAASYFYLEKALNPRTTAEGEFTVTTIDEKDVTAAALPNRGVVVWANPRRLEPKRMTLIERYVRRGGALVVFLGNGDRRLLQDARFTRFVGMRAATTRMNQQREGYTSFAQDHPVFNIFNEEELELLSRTRVRSYVAAQGVSPDSTLAYIGGGDPALWECSRGNGRVLVFAAAPDLESGDIPLSPMFLPLVHTSVSYLASAGGAAHRHRENPPGEPLYFDVPPSTVGSSQLVIRDPAGSLIRPVIVETPQGEGHVICERPTTVGFFELLQDTTVVAEAAVNVDTRESNVAVSTLTDDGDAVTLVGTSDDFVTNLKEERQGREVFAFFIFLATAALVAESILGRKA